MIRRLILAAIAAIAIASPASAREAKTHLAAAAHLPAAELPPVVLPCDPLKLIPGCKQIDGTILSGLVPSSANSAANALAKPFQDLADLINSDADGAIALSTQIPSLQDGNGQQCWMAMKTFGQVFKAHPVPATFKVQTDIEALRLLLMAANNLCSNSHCTQVFSDLANAAQSVSSAPLSLPSLNSLCSKVPQIGVAPIAPAAATTAAPAATPAAPAATPTTPAIP